MKGYNKMLLYYKVVEAFLKLGGKNLSLGAIYEEVYNSLLPIEKNLYKDMKSFRGTISHTIEVNSSDSYNYKGKHNLFKHDDKGVWSLREGYLKMFTDILDNLIEGEELLYWWYTTYDNEIAAISNYRVFAHLDGSLYKGITRHSRIELEEDQIKLLAYNNNVLIFEYGIQMDKLFLEKMKMLVPELKII